MFRRNFVFLTVKIMASKLVKTERLKNVLLIGLNRAPKRNCVNFETAIELAEAIETLEKDEVNRLFLFLK